MDEPAPEDETPGSPPGDPAPAESPQPPEGEGTIQAPGPDAMEADETPSLGDQDWLDRLPFGQRLALAIGAPLLLLLAGVVFATIQVESVQHHEQRMEEQEHTLREVQKLSAAFGDLTEATDEYALTGDAEDGSDVETLISDLQERLRAIHEEEHGISERRLDELDRATNAYIADVREVVSLIEGGEIEQARALVVGPAHEDREDAEAAITASSDEQAEAFGEDAAAVDAAVASLERQLWIGGAVAVVAASGSGFYLTRRSRETFSEITSILSSGATELAATVEQQERATTEQSSSVNQTTTTMEEIEASSSQMKDQAQQASKMAEQVLDQAERGDELVGQTLSSMDETQQRVDEVSERILQLSEQVDQIEEVADVVATIASQVNMLALNASVEASRAGEEGKGFGVVAEEIRKLADQSQKEAERINEIVEQIQHATDATVMAAEQGTKAVDTSLQHSEEAARTFDEIQGSIDRAAERTQQISLGAQEQSSAVSEVYSAMNEISQGSRETASGIAQTKVLVDDLNDVVERLDQLI